LACPRHAPDEPSTASERQQCHPANHDVTQGLAPRITHGDALVMRSSLGGDED
jgi:hypothetical protein